MKKQLANAASAAAPAEKRPAVEVWAERLEKAIRAKDRRGGPREGAGRPTKYVPLVAGKILAALAAGATRRAACAFAEISEATFSNWLKEFFEFSEQVAFAEGKAEFHYTSALAAAAGQDWRAAAFWLKHRRREEWHERTQFEGELGIRPGGGSISITPDEVNRRVKEIYGLDPEDDSEEPPAQVTQ